LLKAGTEALLLARALGAQLQTRKKTGLSRKVVALSNGARASAEKARERCALEPAPSYSEKALHLHKSVYGAP